MSARSWRMAALFSAGLLAVVVAIYAPVRHYGFVPLDDPAYVTDNPHVLGGLTWDGVRWAFTSRWAGYWIPLTWISYMCDVRIFGPAPGAMHVTNLLLHAVNTLLLFGWLRRTTGATGRSAFVAALFAVHPLHVESVAWITERKDVLSTCFMFLTLLAYASFVRRRTAWRYLAVCGLLTAGLLAKPMLVTLPLVLLLCDVWPLVRLPLDISAPDARARWRTAILEKLPMVAIAAAVAVVVFIAQQRVGAMVPLDDFPFGRRVENAVVSIVVYLGQTIWPAGLNVWYAYPMSIPVWQVGGAVALLAGSLLAVSRAPMRPYLAVGWLWYLVTLAPVIGLVQVGVQPRADRFTYVPLIGIFIMVAWGAVDVAARWRVHRRAMAVAAGAVIGVLAVVASVQVTYWENGLTLWGHAAEVTSGRDAAQAHFELGKALMGADRRDEAITHFTAAAEARPDWGFPLAERGFARAQAGRNAEARADYEAALRLSPNLPGTENNLGALLGSQDLWADALPHFEAAVRLQPDLESARVNLGITLLRLGRRQDAIQELSLTVQMYPANAQARDALSLAIDGGKSG